MLGKLERALSTFAYFQLWMENAMKKQSQYILGLGMILANAANAGEDMPPIQGLSGDLPGLLALGAVALIAGVQIARRNKRK